jgi:DNA-binding CsgD family transcriptional regulator
MVGQESGMRAEDELEVLVDRLRKIAGETPRARSIRISTDMLVAERLHGFDAVIQILEAALVETGEDEDEDEDEDTVHRANLAFMYLGGRRLSDAVRVGTEAITRAADQGDTGTEAFARGTAAVALAERGNAVGARETLIRGLALATAIGSRLATMDALRACGTIAAIFDRPRDAAWPLGAAEAAFAPTPLGDPEDDVSSGAGKQWRRARRALAPAAWEVARRDGASTNISLAFDRARDGLDAIGTAEQPRHLRLRRGKFTARELDILTLLGEGRSDTEIGERLVIGPKTASVHVANVKAKLGAANRVEVALHAREMGLINSGSGITLPLFRDSAGRIRPSCSRTAWGVRQRALEWSTD